MMADVVEPNALISLVPYINAIVNNTFLNSGAMQITYIHVTKCFDFI